MKTKENKSREYANWLHKNLEELLGHECAPHDMYYRRGDILQAFDVGWDEALKSQWVMVEDKLPAIGEFVLVLTSNGKISMSKRYQPKDCYGNNTGSIRWSGAYTFEKSIIAWMPIPSFDEILAANKDVLERLKG